MATSTLDNQFPHRISLSQAAEISGYHQDYLGQLCRLGKIKAAKIGRNWYTTKSELESLRQFTDTIEVEQDSLAGFVDSEEEKGLFDFTEPAAPELDSAVPSVDGVRPAISATVTTEELEVSASNQPAPITRKTLAAQPVVADNYIISEVSGIPIRLRADNPSRQHHTIQTLVTRMKLDNLRTEVLQLSDVMQGFSDELTEVKKLVARHEHILKHRKDLATAYAASIDLAPRSIEEKTLLSLEDSADDSPTTVTVFWYVPAAAIAIVVLTAVWSVFSATPENYSAAASLHYAPPIVTNGQVAGDTAENEATSLNSIQRLAE